METAILTVLDLYCCRGGATKGYQNAGFRVIGVDWEPQPDYCGDEFHQGDAIDFVAENRAFIERNVHLVHASPPCQGEGAPTKGTNAAKNAIKGRTYPRLIAPTRAALKVLGLPYVIENVAGSEVRKDLMLCGEMFDLGVLMHRYFEFGHWRAEKPPHPRHRGYVRGWRHGGYREGPYVAAYGRGGGKATAAEMQVAKGIHWTDDHLALREALPPAYTRYIGEQLLAHRARS